MPSLRTLYDWSSRFGWQRRLADLEREALRAAERARHEALREMYERQAREGLLLQHHGTEWLTGLPPGSATADAGVRAIVQGAKLERLARGEPSERTVQGDREEETDVFATFSDAELAALAAAAERLVAGDESAESV